MAELSYFHNGSMRGDSVVSPYTASIFQDILKKLYNSGNINGVIDAPNIFTSALQASASGLDREVDISVGSAFIEGIYFNSDAIESFALDTVTAPNSRWDRIIVRVNWSTQEARLAVVKGAEARSPSVPELQQDAGTLYEFPIARVQVGPAATVDADRVFDERIFVPIAQSEIIDNFMPNSEFMAGADTGMVYTGAAIAAPAYWWCEGASADIRNVFDSSDMVYQQRGNILDVTLNPLETLETNMYLTALNSTAYPNDEAIFTMAFYLHVVSGDGIAIFQDGALLNNVTLTDGPVLILVRGIAWNINPTLELQFYSGGTVNFRLYQVTLTYGVVPAVFVPSKEVVLFNTVDERTYTRSTVSTTIPIYGSTNSGLPSLRYNNSGIMLWQTINDSGSAGNDTINAAISSPTNAVRGEIGRLPNDITGHSTGIVYGSSIYTNVLSTQITASGSDTLDQSVKWTGVFT
jgi:hypothetical protein